jgi:hypothetical protein
MDRIEDESVWLGSPAFADELIGHQPAESLQSTGVFIHVDEVREMSCVFHAMTGIDSTG